MTPKHQRKYVKFSDNAINDFGVVLVHAWWSRATFLLLISSNRHFPCLIALSFPAGDRVAKGSVWPHRG